jgi:hypothetical protein
MRILKIGPWAVRAASLAAVLVSAIAVAGPNDKISRDEIISRATDGHGYGYWWGHGRWKTDGTKMGSCSPTTTGGGCPNCTYSGWDDQGSSVSCPSTAGAFNTETNCYGADCSGFAAKSWDIGSNSDVSHDEHPYRALHFESGAANCTKITRRELLPGDTLANSTHVVIFDHFSPGGKNVRVHEAKGCAYGIVFDTVTGNNMQACRRKNLEPSPTCDPNACNKHGRMSGASCICDSGYSGPSCGSCAPGYQGYPTCVSMFDTCSVIEDIQCGQTIPGTTTSGSSSMSWYMPFCGNWIEDGKEVVYRFQPKINGKAALTLSNIEEGKDVDVMLLAGGCDPMSCLEYGDTGTGEFSVKDRDVFYVAVDSYDGSEGSFELTATCTAGTRGPWIGDKCDTGCEFSDPANSAKKGFCYDKLGSNFCSLSCTQYCPDQAGNAETFCIRDPSTTDVQPKGMCVPKADSILNHCCTDLPGTELKELTRFAGPGSAWVCAPKP